MSKTTEYFEESEIRALAVAKASQGEEEIMHFRVQLQQMSAQKRVKAILERSDIIQVVRSLPVLDFYSTIQEVGISDCLEILELASSEQVQGFIDLDSWNGDRLNPVAVGQWFELLMSANSRGAIKQIRDLDVELLSLLIKMHTKIYEIEEEPDYPDGDCGLNLMTPDNKYAITFNKGLASDVFIHALKYTVEQLFGRDMKFILRLLHASKWELPSQLEEECYRWRNRRLEELGFEEPLQARRIWAYLDPDKELRKGVERPPSLYDLEDAKYNLSTSVLLPFEQFEKGEDIFSFVLRQFPDDVRERILHEVMLCANLLHQVKDISPGDTEELKLTVQEVLHTVGIALSYKGKGKASEAVQYLGHYPILKLFQTGHSLTLRLRSEFRRRIQNKDNYLGKSGLLRIDSPSLEAAAGILRLPPLFYAGLIDEKSVDYRPFVSLGEITKTTQSLVSAAFRSSLLGQKGWLNDENIAKWLGDTSVQPRHSQLLTNIMIRMCFAQDKTLKKYDSTESERCAPMTNAELNALKESGLLENLKIVNIVKQDIIDASIGLSPIPGALNPDELKERLATWIDETIEGCQTELKSVTGQIDGRFLSSVWFIEKV